MIGCEVHVLPDSGVERESAGSRQVTTREAASSNIGPKTSYPDRHFVVFLIPSKG